MRVALVNTNRMRPAISPIGLEYVAEALAAAGHAVTILDLCWAADIETAVAGFFAHEGPGLVGVTLRNTDDCAFSSRESFVRPVAGIVDVLRRHTAAPVIMGGAGFSVIPEQVLSAMSADAGVWGEGEFVLPELARRLERGRSTTLTAALRTSMGGEAWSDLPNLIVRDGNGWRRNPAGWTDLATLPPMRRNWFDNARYFREGGQLGFETKRGCPEACVYCADPVAKGRHVRVRPPAAVADEVEALLAQGIDHLHTCDCEFNLPPVHARAVCDEFIGRGLGERVRWYAYCTPGPFPPELADRMRRAGCVGINFGTDSGDAAMLRRLRRGFTPEDICRTVRACKEAGIIVMLDLLLGAPGETADSLRRTIELTKEVDADRVGVAVGVRIYPGTELGRPEHRAALAAGLIDMDVSAVASAKAEGASDPPFFVEPAVAADIFPLLDRLIGKDPRFLFFDPTRPDQNYNYNANDRLVEAIRRGARGAYWDILRRLEA